VLTGRGLRSLSGLSRRSLREYLTAPGTWDRAQPAKAASLGVGVVRAWTTWTGALSDTKCRVLPGGGPKARGPHAEGLNEIKKYAVRLSIGVALPSWKTW
jgi:hypothetical protein